MTHVDACACRMPSLRALVLEPAANLCGAVVPDGLPVLNGDTGLPVMGPLNCEPAAAPAAPAAVRRQKPTSLAAGAIAGEDVSAYSCIFS